MSVLMVITTVTFMPLVPTLLETSPAHAIQASLEMEQLAWVSITHARWTPKFKLNHFHTTAINVYTVLSINA